MTLIMHFIKSDGDDELKESCLQAFEALVVRCFREITPHIREVGTDRVSSGEVPYLVLPPPPHTHSHTHTDSGCVSSHAVT